MAKLDAILLLADDKYQISYRPRLNRITGGVKQTILLQQIIFRWKNVGRKPFYKFKEPCNHGMYVNGDSWCEELGFTSKEFDTALKSISQRLKKGEEKKKDVFVHYWVESSHITYYEVNEAYLSKKLLQVYGVKNDA